jgi:uncharacterized lipoprotein YddW (UPF0748 family)
MKKILGFALAALAVASVASCGQKQKAAADEDPIFWTWLTYNGTEKFDSTLTVMEELGIGGVNLDTHADTAILRKCVEIAQKHGIKVYSWFVSMNAANGVRTDSLLEKHRDWFSVNRLGRSLADTVAYVDYYKFLCPALPEVREYLNGKVKAICEVKGIEGVSLDYHRFVDVVLPTTLWSKYGVVQDREYPEWDFGYHPAMIAKFKEKYGYDPREEEDPTMDEKWRQFRCDQIAEVANLFAETIHSYGLKMAASPFPTPKMSARMVRQDWGDWDLDDVFPMVYTDFYTMDPSFAYDCTVENVRDKNPKTKLYTGLFFSHNDEWEIFDNMDEAFRGGAQGISIFTVNNLRSPEIRARFREYTDSVKAIAAKNGGKMPAVKVPAAADPDEFHHPGLMKRVEEKIASMAGVPSVKLGDYKLVNEFNVTKTYDVTDSVSGKTFQVSFWHYGDVVSGWDVAEAPSGEGAVPSEGTKAPSGEAAK